MKFYPCHLYCIIIKIPMILIILRLWTWHCSVHDTINIKIIESGCTKQDGKALLRFRQSYSCIISSWMIMFVHRNKASIVPVGWISLVVLLECAATSLRVITSPTIYITTCVSIYSSILNNILSNVKDNLSRIWNVYVVLLRIYATTYFQSIRKPYRLIAFLLWLGIGF